MARLIPSFKSKRNDKPQAGRRIATVESNDEIAMPSSPKLGVRLELGRIESWYKTTTETEEWSHLQHSMISFNESGVSPMPLCGKAIWKEAVELFPQLPKPSCVLNDKQTLEFMAHVNATFNGNFLNLDESYDHSIVPNPATSSGKKPEMIVIVCETPLTIGWGKNMTTEKEGWFDTNQLRWL